jgi:hypothetical protein
VTGPVALPPVEPDADFLKLHPTRSNEVVSITAIKKGFRLGFISAY